jgi:hypothetical protein
MHAGKYIAQNFDLVVAGYEKKRTSEFRLFDAMQRHQQYHQGTLCRMFVLSFALCMLYSDARGKERSHVPARAKEMHTYEENRSLHTIAYTDAVVCRRRRYCSGC